MGKLLRLVRSIPSADGIISFGARIGIWGFIWNLLAVLWALLVTTVVGIWSKIPWWALPLIFTGVAAVSVWMVARGMAAWRDFLTARVLKGYDSSELEEFGRHLSRMANEMFGFIAERQKEHMYASQQMGFGQTSPEEVSKRWDFDRNFDNLTTTLFAQKFNSGMLADYGRLAEMGLRVPQGANTLMARQPQSAAKFFGLMGNFLSKGDLDGALRAVNDRSVMWTII